MVHLDMVIITHPRHEKAFEPVINVNRPKINSPQGTGLAKICGPRVEVAKGVLAIDDVKSNF